VNDAPFDLARFFEAPPPDRNAASLYLDALFEFSSDVAGCFPEGPERIRRHQTAEDRFQRYSTLIERLKHDAKSVSDDEIDEVIKQHEEGFRKIALAQRRDRCVFQSDLGLGARSPMLWLPGKLRASRH
jgi:hypothetical protein